MPLALNGPVRHAGHGWIAYPDLRIMDWLCLERASAVADLDMRDVRLRCRGRLSTSPPAAFLGCDQIIQAPATIAELVSALRRRRASTANELGKPLGV